MDCDFNRWWILWRTHGVWRCTPDPKWWWWRRLHLDVNLFDGIGVWWVKQNTNQKSQSGAPVLKITRLLRVYNGNIFLIRNVCLRFTQDVFETVRRPTVFSNIQGLPHRSSKTEGRSYKKQLGSSAESPLESILQHWVDASCSPISAWWADGGRSVSKQANSPEEWNEKDRGILLYHAEISNFFCARFGSKYKTHRDRIGHTNTYTASEVKKNVQKKTRGRWS